MTGKKKIFFLLLIFIFLILFGIRKLHLQNFWIGKKEIAQLNNEKFPTKSKGEKFSDFIYIAHGGGGYNHKTYLNNLEAIDNSYYLGVNFIEIDLNYTSDSVVVLAHDFIKSSKDDFISEKTSGTHLSLKDLMGWLMSKKIHLITDIKTDNIKTLRWIINNYPTLYEKIIPQAYTISEIAIIKKMGFKEVIFTNYISCYPNSIIEELASTKVLYGLTLPYDINFKLLSHLNDLKKLPTPILTHTINDVDIAAELRTSGCSGIYTDFLLVPSGK